MLKKKNIALLIALVAFLIAIAVPSHVFAWQVNCQTGYNEKNEFDCGWQPFNCHCFPPPVM